MTRKKFLTAVYLFLICMILGFGMATQSIAKELDYDSGLGSPIFFYQNTPVYFPLKFLQWYLGFYDLAPQYFRTPFLYVYFSFACGAFGAALIMKRPKKLDVHGTATWASSKEIQNAGLFAEDGLVIGVHKDTGKYIRHNGPEHMIVGAPTRSGKGVGLVNPILLSYTRSALIFDPKQELWNITAGFRKEAMGHQCIKFEPTDISRKSACFNPFDEIRVKTEREVPDVQNIVSLIIDPQGKGELIHWQQAAQSLLVGTILHLKYLFPDDANLFSLVELMTAPSEDRPNGIVDLLVEMRDMDHVEEGDETLVNLYQTSGETAYKHPIVRMTAQEMLQKADEELRGVISTAVTLLSVYRDPLLGHYISKSDFCVNDLMNHHSPVSLYLVVPPSDLVRLAPIFRLMVDLIVRRNIEKMEFENGKPKRTHKYDMLMLLDEFPAFGRMETIEAAMAYTAGYGIRFFLIVQSLNQLRKIYTENNSIIDNCHIRIFFTPNDVNTTRYIVDLLGKVTVEIENESDRKDTFFGGSRSTQQVGRNLMTNEETLKLSKSEAIVFAAGMSPIKCEKIMYYSDSNFKKRVFPPPVETDRISGIESERIN